MLLSIFVYIYPEIFYIITQWSRRASGSSWEMPDSNPGPLPQKSGALPMAMSHHISHKKVKISGVWKAGPPMYTHEAKHTYLKFLKKNFNTKFPLSGWAGGLWKAWGLYSATDHHVVQVENVDKTKSVFRIRIRIRSGFDPQSMTVRIGIQNQVLKKMLNCPK